MNNKLNQRLAIIDDEDRGKIEMAKEKNDVIKEAEVEITYFTASEEARYLADMRDLWESDRVSELNYEKRIAQKEGREEGRKEGIKEGKIKIARKLLKKKMKIDEIIEITELTREEIEKLNNKK